MPLPAAAAAIPAIGDLIFQLMLFSAGDKLLDRGSKYLFGNPELDILREQGKLQREDSAAQLSAMKSLRKEDQLKEMLLRQLAGASAYREGQSKLRAAEGQVDSDAIQGALGTGSLAAPTMLTTSPVTMSSILGVPL